MSRYSVLHHLTPAAVIYIAISARRRPGNLDFFLEIGLGMRASRRAHPIVASTLASGWNFVCAGTDSGGWRGAWRAPRSSIKMSLAMRAEE